jgi:hypothetical protein
MATLTTESIREGNIKIHVFMGYELMTNAEKVASTTSRDVDDIDDFCRRIGNLPDIKPKGSVVTTISEHVYSQHLSYHRSMDALMPVLQKINDTFHPGYDLLAVIHDLLSDGYLFGSKERLPKLPLSAVNLWSRVVMLIESNKISA